MQAAAPSSVAPTVGGVAPNPHVFALQIGVTKAGGGIETAIRHYARLFRAVGVESVCAYRGPELASLRSERIDVVEAGKSLTSPVYSLFAGVSPFRRLIERKAAGRTLLAVVHSDRALGAVRRMFPDSVVVAPCHTDKTSRRANADLVVTLNSSQHRIVCETIGDRAHVAMLGNPYVSAGTHHAPRPAAGPPRIVFCARLTETKNPMLLLQAAANLKTRPLPELLFIGTGPLDEQLRSAAGSSPAGVAFAGWLGDPWSAFRRDDILVLPSTWEGLPYLLQEALDREIPIIASDNAGNREALCDGAHGALFKSGDARSLAAEIDKALADPTSLHAMARLGRKKLFDRFGAQAFWNALSNALATGGPDGRRGIRRAA